MTRKINFIISLIKLINPHKTGKTPVKVTHSCVLQMCVKYTRKYSMYILTAPREKHGIYSLSCIRKYIQGAP